MIILQNIKQIHAKTTTNNVASRVILEKNGFAYMRADKETFEMNGLRLAGQGLQRQPERQVFYGNAVKYDILKAL